MSECTCTSTVLRSLSDAIVIIAHVGRCHPDPGLGDPGAVNCACLHDDDLPRHPLHGRLQQVVSIHITAPTDRLLRLLPPQTTLPAALVIFFPAPAHAGAQAEAGTHGDVQAGWLVAAGQAVVVVVVRPSVSDETCSQPHYSPRAACTHASACTALHTACTQYSASIVLDRSANGVIRK